jgi:hypothetical protein
MLETETGLATNQAVPGRRGSQLPPWSACVTLRTSLRTQAIWGVLTEDEVMEAAAQVTPYKKERRPDSLGRSPSRRQAKLCGRTCGRYSRAVQAMSLRA